MCTWTARGLGNFGFRLGSRLQHFGKRGGLAFRVCGGKDVRLEFGGSCVQAKILVYGNPLISPSGVCFEPSSA